jgi:hypothetical protein
MVVTAVKEELLVLWCHFFFPVKDEAFFIDSAGVMAFSGFFSSTTWSSLDLNEPKHDADKV